MSAAAGTGLGPRSSPAFTLYRETDSKCCGAKNETPTRMSAAVVSMELTAAAAYNSSPVRGRASCPPNIKQQKQQKRRELNIDKDLTRITLHLGNDLFSPTFRKPQSRSDKLLAFNTLAAVAGLSSEGDTDAPPSPPRTWNIHHAAMGAGLMLRSPVSSMNAALAAATRAAAAAAAAGANATVAEANATTAAASAVAAAATPRVAIAATAPAAATSDAAASQFVPPTADFKTAVVTAPQSVAVAAVAAVYDQPSPSTDEKKRAGPAAAAAAAVASPDTPVAESTKKRKRPSDQPAYGIGDPNTFKLAGTTVQFRPYKKLHS